MADDPWLSPSELDAWLSLSAVLQSLPGAIDAQLKTDAGVNLFEYTVLAMLSEESGHTMTMSELADIAFGSLSRLSHAISRLESRGWVERRAGDGGRRHNVVSLTAEGLATIRAAAPTHVAYVRSVVIDVLSDDEVASLASISKKLLAAADPDFHEHVVGVLPTIIERNRDGD